MEPVNRRLLRPAGSQSGVALIMVLIMLAAMAIAGVALVRIVDSANVISGNFAFRQATLNIADLGVEAANKLKEMKDLKKQRPDGLRELVSTQMRRGIAFTIPSDRTARTWSRTVACRIRALMEKQCTTSVGPARIRWLTCRRNITSATS